MADVMESCVVSQPTKRGLRRQPQGARPTATQNLPAKEIFKKSLAELSNLGNAKRQRVQDK